MGSSPLLFFLLKSRQLNLHVGQYPAHREAWQFIDEQNVERVRDLKQAAALINPDIQAQGLAKCVGGIECVRPECSNACVLSCDKQPAEQPSVGKRLSRFVALYCYMTAACNDDSSEDVAKMFGILSAVFSEESDALCVGIAMLKLKDSNRVRFAFA